MIRLLPARPPLARWRRLLAALPHGSLTALTVVVSAAVVVAGPTIATGAPMSAFARSVDAVTQLSESATAEPSASARPGTPSATAETTRLVSMRAAMGVAELLAAAADGRQAGVPMAHPVVSTQPDSPAERGEPAGTDVLAGTLDDTPGTGFDFDVRSTAAGPKGTLVLRSGAGVLTAGSIRTLAAAGATATWTGTGTWNGTPGYTFTATAVDSSAARSGASSIAPTPDRLAITIRDPRGNVVMGADWPVRSGDVVVRTVGSGAARETSVTVTGA